jgi:YbbR domain-containing protein
VSLGAGENPTRTGSDRERDVLRADSSIDTVTGSVRRAHGPRADRGSKLARFGRLPDFVTRNSALRLIALVLAVGLWVFVNAGQHEAQVPLQVPVSYRRLRPGMVIVNQHPDFVQIQVSGPRTLLSLLDPGRLEVRLDLNDVTPGQVSFRINPEMFTVTRQTSVTSISPSQIVLEVDRIIRRDLPVHLDLIGLAPSGLAVAGIDLKPSTVTVTGPSRDLSRLERIDTEPLDVRGASDQLARTLALLVPGQIKVSDTEVEATVKFAEVMGEREFRTVPVKVRDADHKYRLYTKEVSVTVHGPVRRLSSLSLDGLVYVQARGVQPGMRELPVQVDLPEGMSVLRQTPDRIRLRILGSKVESRG